MKSTKIKLLFLMMIVIFVIIQCGTLTGPNAVDFGTPKDLFPQQLEEQDFLLSYRKEDLEATKRKLVSGDPTTLDAYNGLIQRANNYLNGPLYSVTDYNYPPRINKNYYASVARYFWPTDGGSNYGEWTGLPWVSKDGIPNPENGGEGTIGDAKTDLCNGTLALGLAYYFTGDIRYSDKVANMVRRWFLNPDTRMIPDGSYSQATPGRKGTDTSVINPDTGEKIIAYTGSMGGMIDFLEFIFVIDAVLLIIDSGSLSVSEYKELIDWYKEFIVWLESDNIVTQGWDNRHNNQAVWREADFAAFYIFTSQVVKARSRYDIVMTMMRNGFANDGSQIDEKGRTISYNYHVYGLRAWMALARLWEIIGEDVWYKYDDGKTLKTAVNFMVPYVKKPGNWPYIDYNPSSGRRAASMDYIAAAQYGNDYEDITDLLESASEVMKENSKDLENLVFPRIIE